MVDILKEIVRGIVLNKKVEVLGSNAIMVKITIFTKTQINVQEQHLLYDSTFHSHSRVFNN